MPTFQVLVNPPALRGERGSEQAIVVTATNTIERPATARASVRTESQAAKGWITAVREVQGRFPQRNATQDFLFTLKVPADAPAGSYQFLLDVIDMDLPDDHFGTSAPVPLVLEKIPENGGGTKPRPWWPWVVGAGVLLLGVGFALWRVFGGSGPKMPALQGRPYAQAMADLDTARFVITRVDTLHADTTSFTRGVIISQSIPPKTKLKPDSNVLRLVVQRSYAVVPSLIKRTSLEAARRLGAESLLIILGQQESQGADDVVLESRPPAGTLVVRGQRIGVLILTRVPCTPPACSPAVGQLLFTRRRAAVADANQEALQNWKPK